MTTLEDFTKAIQNIGIDTKKLKMRFIKNGKYGEPELWVYKKFLTGTHGYLVTEETIKDKRYLRDYLSDFI